MKKYLIPISVALILGLAACEQPAAEVTPSAAVTPAPKPAVTVPATAAPSAARPAVTATPTPEPMPTEAVTEPSPTPAPTPKPKPVPTPTPAPVETPEVTPEPMPVLPPEVILTPEPSEGPVQPTDEEVLEAYHMAEEAYRWFDLTTLPVASDTGLIGTGYYPVADERFPTMEALRTHLKGLFSDEVVDRLLPLDGEHYVEIDGVLYAAQMDRGSNENTGPITETVLWPKEGGEAFCTVHVEVTLLWEDPDYPDGKRVYDFPYQRVGDKWVFTQFGSIM